jgi:hypothetical protein
LQGRTQLAIEFFEQFRDIAQKQLKNNPADSQAKFNMALSMIYLAMNTGKHFNIGERRKLLINGEQLLVALERESVLTPTQQHLLNFYRNSIVQLTPK